MATTIAAFIFVITVLVFVHELGHFLMARLFGVRVITFSIGFGPKLARMQYRGVEYCVSAIPLGGYVKMATGQPGHARDDEYHGKTKWQRVLIMAAGPAMNFLLAIAILTGIALQGVDMPSSAGLDAARFHPTLWQALTMAVQATAALTMQVVATVRGLLSGAVSLRDLAGPVGIARIAGESVRSGWMELLAVMTMLSLNLGIMNLLPVPALDGGHIALMAIEGLRRRDFSIVFRRRVMAIGIAVLAAATVATLYNDVSRIATPTHAPASSASPSTAAPASPQI